MRKRIVGFLLMTVLIVAAIPAQADGPLRERLRERMQERMTERKAGQPSRQTAVQTQQLAGLSVAYWHRAEQSSQAPVVLFSHGFNGCKTQSTFLMEAMATSGYAVFAPDHADAGCKGRETRGKPDEKFGDAAKWNDQTYANRAQDIRNVLAALKADAFWSNRLDFDRVALVGHSLGGYTMLGLAGAWPGWRMHEIKAALVLSPYAAPFVEQQTLGGVHVPVMYQGGTRDFGITPIVNRKGGAYDQTPSAAYYVEFDEAGHFAWADIKADKHAAIIHYSLWFLDRTLKGTTSSLDRQVGVTDLRSK